MASFRHTSMFDIQTHSQRVADPQRDWTRSVSQLAVPHYKRSTSNTHFLSMYHLCPPPSLTVSVRSPVSVLLQDPKRCSVPTRDLNHIGAGHKYTSESLSDSMTAQQRWNDILDSLTKNSKWIESSYFGFHLCGQTKAQTRQSFSTDAAVLGGERKKKKAVKNWTWQTSFDWQEGCCCACYTTLYPDMTVTTAADVQSWSRRMVSVSAERGVFRLLLCVKMQTVSQRNPTIPITLRFCSRPFVKCHLKNRKKWKHNIIYVQAVSASLKEEFKNKCKDEGFLLVVSRLCGDSTQYDYGVFTVELLDLE